MRMAIGLVLALAGSLPVRALAAVCPVLVVVGLADEAEVAAGPGVRVVTSAANAGLLRERLAGVEGKRLSAVVSFGIAGALDEALAVGDLRVATRVVSGERSWTADPRMRRAFRRRMAGPGAPEFEETVFLGNDELTGVDAEANRALHRASGADVVDMESHIAAEFARRHALPFAAIRAISDTAGQTLPPAALLPLRPDGTGDPWAVLRSVLRQPSQVPDLWAMFAGFRAALDTLRAVRERLDLSELAPCPPAVLRRRTPGGSGP